jgi:ribosomal protein L7/L12
LLLAVVVAVLVIWMQNRQESVENPDHDRLSTSLPLPGAGSPNPPPTPEDTAVADLASYEAQALALMKVGNKLEAIKVYRAATGVGLAEAKSAVERLESGSRLPLPPEASPKTGAPSGEARIRELIVAGNKIGAIKVYREITGSDLITAKNAVEAMERGEPMTTAAIRQPPESTADTDTQIRTLLAAGHKIDAIKIHRAAYGSSLQEAKEAVEAVERAMKFSGGEQT